MHPRCNGSILLGTIVICVALAVMESDISVKKPFGRKMCDRVCNQIVGCHSCIYRTIYLSCDPIQLKSPKQKPGRDKERINADNASKCNQGWNMFDNKRGIIKCRPILSSHRIISTIGEDREVGMTRILIYSNRKRWQLYIDNNSLVEYPFGRDIYIKAVGYVSSQGKLVVSSHHPNRLFFTPIDIKKKAILKTKYLVYAIAIDDHKQLVFMKVFTPEPCVCVMSTDGKNFRSLFNLATGCSVNFRGGFVADHKRSLIYILCPKVNILHFTYQGVSKGKVVDTPGSGFGLCLDAQRDVLYYQGRKGYLTELSLSHHTVKTIHTLKVPTLYGILTVGNILYMQPRPGDQIHVVDMHDMRTATKINMYHKGILGMCLIP